MRRFIIKLLSCFIPSKTKRHAFRTKWQAKPFFVFGDPFKKFKKDNIVEIDPENAFVTDLSIKGRNNKVIIKKFSTSYMGRGNKKLFIKINGSNNSVVIDEGMNIGDYLYIQLGQTSPVYGESKNISLSIGKKTSFEECKITTYNSNAAIEIGNECMISYNTAIYHTDGHPVLDIADKKIINKVKKLSIGNHVWIGANASIMKNTVIADDCIVGWGSVVSGKFASPHCAIAGNPAKVVKEGITWDWDCSKGYVQNE